MVYLNPHNGVPQSALNQSNGVPQSALNQSKGVPQSAVKCVDQSAKGVGQSA